MKFKKKYIILLQYKFILHPIKNIYCLSLCYINHEYILCVNPIFEYNKYIST